MTEFSVQLGDVVSVPSDLLLLKHAQCFYGADESVAARLISAKVCSENDLRPQPGDFAVVETHGALMPERVMFLGTPRLRGFTYEEMYIFARRAIEAIVRQRLPVRTLTTTIHGAGYGLDGGESLQRLVQGFQEGLARHSAAGIEKIIFLTIREREYKMLSAMLAVNAAQCRGEPTAPHPEEPF